MRNIYLLLIAALGLAACSSATSSPTQMAEKELRHVVLFKFNDGALDADVEKVHQAFLNLATEIAVVKSFEWGLNDSPEDLHQDFTHCYVLTFDSEADRDSVYAPHPAHQAFVSSLGPHLEKAFVVDFWANQVMP